MSDQDWNEILGAVIVVLVIFHRFALPKLLLLLGGAMNYGAERANGGLMPVYGIAEVPSDVHCHGHAVATAATRLPWLADWLWGASPGDALVLAGLALVPVLVVLHERRRR